VVTASGITVRSAMMLIASGYLPESGGPARRMIEAGLNARAILDDSSGQYGRRFMEGHPRGLTKLATQYGSVDEIEALSKVTHADSRGPSEAAVDFPVQGDGFAEAGVNLWPDRDPDQAHDLLYAIAYECGRICACLAEAFSVPVEIPPWVTSELLRLRDLLEQRRSASP
jgi:hypothetical protein